MDAAGSPRPFPVRVLQWFTGPWTRANLRSWVRLIAAVVLLKGFILDQYRIPSGSMEPTLHGDPAYFSGDRVLVNKLAYGLRVPFTNAWLARWDTPGRWEIVTFDSPERDNPNPLLIKRVVGLPGEHVRIDGGDIYIDGERVVPAGLSQWYYVSQFDLTGRAQSPRLSPEERAFFRQLSESVDLRFGVRPEEEYARVPAGHYFVLGDNSIVSRDSRVYGFVPEENIYARATTVWWPFWRMRDLTGWSATWWGRALLLALPLALLLLEVFGMRRRRRAKVVPAQPDADSP